MTLITAGLSSSATTHLLSLFHLFAPTAGSAPNDPEEAYKLFRSFFYITHMQQARCYESAINYWRRLRSQPAGLTMGVLYWQLNDIAAFASWSGYDYEGEALCCLLLDTQ
jgi:hypothetical protein